MANHIDLVKVDASLRRDDPTCERLEHARALAVAGLVLGAETDGPEDLYQARGGVCVCVEGFRGGGEGLEGFGGAWRGRALW